MLLVGAVLLGGCGEVAPSRATPTAPGPVSYALPDGLVGNTCAGVGTGPLILHGRLVDGVAEAWAGDAITIRWPSGYVARFEPDLIVLDADGVVRGREGEDMTADAPWHDQLVCPFAQVDANGGLGALAIDVFPPSPAVACGPLAADHCAKAVTVAEGTFPASHQPFISVRIESPTPTRTCPPSGGPSGSHICGVIATVTTVDTAVAVGLVPTDGGWVWSGLIR